MAAVPASSPSVMTVVNGVKNGRASLTETMSGPMNGEVGAKESTGRNDLAVLFS